MISVGQNGTMEIVQEQKKEDDSSRVTVTVVKPDISLEWTDMKVSFRIMGDDSAFQLFPTLDPNSPSARSVRLKSRRRNKGNHVTLSGYISASPSQSVDSSNSENGNGSNNGSSTSVKPSKCHICGRMFNKGTYLKRHILSHNTVKPFKCNVCNWGFYQHCNLKRHMTSHTVQEGGEGFNCTHCQATFTTKSVLTVHLRDAHGDKMVGKKPVAIQGPKKAGTNNMPAPAPIINNTTMNNAAAANAAAMCRCHICGKQFLTSTNLQQHLIFHRGHKSFKCNMCGARFAQRANLKKHMVLSHSKGHPCPFCDIVFRSKEDLSQHVVSLHPQESRAHDMGTIAEEEEEIPEPNM